MITPALVKEQAGKKYLTFLKAYLADETFFPLVFPVGELPKTYQELESSVQTLKQHSKDRQPFGYRLEWNTSNTRQFGTQTLPTRVIFDQRDDYLHFIHKYDEFDGFAEDIEFIRGELPQLDQWIMSNPQSVINYHGKWGDLLAVCRYFLQHPRPNLYARELPLSVDTKFIEVYRSILGELLSAVLPDTALDRDAITFEGRFGLRVVEPTIRLRFLDHKIAPFWQIEDIELPLSQFKKLPVNPQRIIIVENKITFLTLPVLPKTIGIWGHGYQAIGLGQVGWFVQPQIGYWGDLDVQGFEILSGVRSHYPQTESLMMDQSTWEKYHSYSVMGTVSKYKTLSNLTPDESLLYEWLLQNNLRLEQERLHQTYVVERLESWLKVSTV